MSIFGKLFDFNRDGELNVDERGAELNFVVYLLQNPNA